MGQRKKARELVLKCLYAHDSTGESVDSICETLIRTAELAEDSQRFAEQLFRKVAENTQQLDEKITAFSQNWDIERVAMVDLCILRIAICEFTSFPEIPVKVSINEAVELAKKYSTQQSSRFVNGILDAIYKSLEQV
ncbi:MAG: transcription antitermination factor NusB [Candidatus Zixiibacteriota bacterium]|nr:MAG: transcription antitermination factor NusB [candidate division Zixibacteria bacterium]